MILNVLKAIIRVPFLFAVFFINSINHLLCTIKENVSILWFKHIFLVKFTI